MKPCTIEQQDGVAVITLRSPKGNALNAELVRTVEETLDIADRDAATGVVLTATGTTFCVGLDLLQHHEAPRATVQAFVAGYSRLLRRLFGLDKPLVIALNGHAYAGGAVLLLTGDYRIGVSDQGSRVAFGEVALGLPLPHVPELVVRQALADHAQRRILLTGHAVEMPRALELGLVDELVPARDLLATAIDRARSLGRFPLGFKTTKRDMRRATLAQMNAAIKTRDVEFLAAWFSESTQAAIGAVKAKLLAKKGT